ncbi:protein WVD2-like 7 isoform X1 [Nicotiana sylvestris]|uniref:Uncharacterized protein LOC104229349 isoform X2 n=1 Tax=Nicotiana sylvestris TaxID=4096 RepID=A0A1U7X1C3_NICSY|nr:PREDICTED: uncharacterized protein LOC104229349 isoform X2 [Nicotiana sylvestris]
MGESIVQTPAVKHKMGESVVSGPRLEVSVSFGRFENDALSWEKWSSFSPNKYLEEVEKCSTPGSVAQKKAYFEAHYKKIAAKKLEQLEEETQQVEKETEPHVSDGDFSSSNGEQKMLVKDFKTSDEVDEPKADTTVDLECDNLLLTNAKELTISGIDESKEDISVDKECVSSLVTEVKEGTVSGVDESKEDITIDVECDSSLVTKPKEETILGTCDQEEVHKVEEWNPEKECQDSVVEIPQADSEARKSSFKKSKTPKANVKIAPRKVHTVEDRVSAGTKKKLTSPVTKSARIFIPTSTQASTSKVITPSQPSVKKVSGTSTQRSNNTPLAQRKKVVPGSFASSPSQSSNKKLNGATPLSSNKKLNGATMQRSKNSPVLESKRAAPTSLHMSLSLSSANSTASNTTMRKSLIMEKMGDKDIVKRAFRAFQNSFSQGRSTGDMTYGGQDQALSKESEQKISTSLTPLKESERLRKMPNKEITLKGQSGARSAYLSSGAPKDGGMVKKKVNSIRASTGSRTDRSADKWKEEVTKVKIKRPGSNR